MGLKKDWTMDRRDPLKGRVPKDKDGAFRVNKRLDGKTREDLLKKVGE